MLPSEERRVPPSLEPGLSVPLEIVLVAADTGLVAALRICWLSHDFSRALHDAIRDQAGQPFDQDAYDAHLDAIRDRYPTAELVPHAYAYQDFTALSESE